MRFGNLLVILMISARASVTWANLMDSAPIFSESVAADPLPQRPRQSSGWLPFLLISLLVVVVLALISPVMEQVEYSRTRGEVRALSETIPDLNLKTLLRYF
jgi:hypothetical protein